MRLRELAEKLECRLVGDGEIDVRGLAPFDEAEDGDLTFVAHPRYLLKLEASRASAVILKEGVSASSKPALLARDPYLAFVKALYLFYPPERPAPGVHPSTIVAPGVRLAEGVSIGPFSYIEEGVVIGPRSAVGPQVYIGRGSSMGADCRVYPQVTIREGVEIGDRVILHSGAVVGSDGFGYLRDRGGARVKIPQVGRVILEDDVEIGANVAIDRATLGTTRLKRGTKIDNLVQIAHNVTVGEDTVIAAQTGISGSTKIGNRVTLAGQVGIVDHVTIGDDVTIGAQAGVISDLPPGMAFWDTPAVPHFEAKRNIAGLHRLPLLLKSLQSVESRLRALEEAFRERWEGALRPEPSPEGESR
ncbi:MAG TPA: UDP-3-O-(3-hydroxymyristoyl)glucosamine N-acyltransferase [Candidatus Methylomirabilis sp.]|nr:UDP-3-O-(3-hydroxymyristoyl)glucosamine N-acyltransferase [Candidatus Methylomirabilis sp.]